MATSWDETFITATHAPRHVPWWRRAMWRVTGGRPMMKVAVAFTDVVTHEQVYYFLDKRHRLWLATSPWATFRVPSTYRSPT